LLHSSCLHPNHNQPLRDKGRKFVCNATSGA
jgi:hypothetical protein